MNFKQILKSPFYIAQLATGAKSFEKNPLLGSKRLNEMGLHGKRVETAMRMAQWRRKSLAKSLSAEQVEEYDTNGVVMIHDFLPRQLFETIQAELKRDDFERYDMLQGSTITRRASLDVDQSDKHPGLNEAKNDPRMANLLRYVASYGGQPLLTLQIVMALSSAVVSAKKIDPQTLLHSDTFHPTAKSWLFLTDVEEDDGPFSYVKGSHKMTPERYAWENEIAQNVNSLENKYAARGSLRISNENLDSLGYPQATKVIVPANTLVVADTHGFHARCASPKNTTRVEIYGSLRRNPFLPYNGLHLGALPYVKDRNNKMVIDGLASLEKMGVRKSPWKEVGTGKIDEWPQRLLDLGKVK